MKNYISFTLAATLLGSLSLSATPKSGAMEKPDFTKGDKIPEKAKHDWNLGATGMRGWMYSDALSTSDARQIKITKMIEGSPAHDQLQVGDVILGVNGKPFSYDPRTELGKALTDVEAKDGVLSLNCWSAGKQKNVKLKLPVLGAYSATAPYNCEKSAKILKLGCEALAKRIKAGERRRHPITRSLNALALLASGEKKYLPLLKEEAEWAVSHQNNGLKTWSYSYVLIFLSEYKLATGDESVMPGITRLAMESVRGQSVVGSWGHRFVDQDGTLMGYGMMNAPGIPLTIGLVLAREAGVENKEIDEAIAKSANLVRFYEGKGAIPYGDHSPWTETHDDNGKCGMASVLFSMLGEEKPAKFFSMMGLASYGSERDLGHTGNYLNIMWSLPSVANLGPNATGAWMQEFGCWYYDLARKWDGNFIHQGQPQMRIDKYKGWDSTGLYLLHYAMPLKHIHLTGKKTRILEPLTQDQVKSVINDGAGYSSKYKMKYYNSLSSAELIKRLGSWSPIVRERAVKAFGEDKQDEESESALIKMLSSESVSERIGASQTLGKMRSAKAVQSLRLNLKSDDLWLRIQSANALAAIGQPAMAALPELLEIHAKGPTKEDPRGMEQRYLNFAIFGKMLKSSIENVDKTLLNRSVIAGLKNEDGLSRGSVASIYNKLSYEELKPLLPAIYEAVDQPAPSGIMFLAKVRMSGLELMAKHKIKEGIPLCFKVMSLDKWGKSGRISRCLKVISAYGGAAESLLPELKELEKMLTEKKGNTLAVSQLALVKKVIKKVETKVSPELRSMY